MSHRARNHDRRGGGDFANIFVLINDMFLHTGAYKGQTLDKTRRTFETRIRKKANKTAIKHTFF
jgi:hypothetical protein